METAQDGLPDDFTILGVELKVMEERLNKSDLKLAKKLSHLATIHNNRYRAKKLKWKIK